MILISALPVVPEFRVYSIPDPLIGCNAGIDADVVELCGDRCARFPRRRAIYQDLSYLHLAGI